MASKDKAMAGGFVIGGLLLFALGLFLIGDRRMLFASSTDYYSEFLQVSALETGAKVRVAGMDAGEVLDVQVPSQPGTKFRVKFRVLSKLLPVIRTDSVTSIQTDGLLGNKYLFVSSGGNRSPAAPAGSTLLGREPFEIGDLLTQIGQTVGSLDGTVALVKTDISDTTRTMADTAKHVDEIVSGSQNNIKEASAAIARIMDSTSAILAKVNDGTGTVGKLINDDSIYKSVSGGAAEFAKTLDEVRQSSVDIHELIAKVKDGTAPADLERTVKNVADATDRLRLMVAAFQPSKDGGDGMMDDVRATLGSTRDVMSNLSENLEALKRSFFFRGFFKDRGFYNLSDLSPVEYQSKEFDKQVQKERVWVQQSELFLVKADGSEEISPNGRNRLDLAMANFLRFAKDRAVIVEGYASTGSMDEQFLLSRTRAIKVRDYIIKKFSLSPEYVGIMPMGAVTRSSNSEGGFEEGVALVLLKK